GKASWTATPKIDVAALDGTNGFTLFGIDAGDRSGWAVSSAGDINGDGFDDLAIGARHADAAVNAKADAGETEIVVGKSNWAAAPSISLSTLDGTNGFTLFGVDAGDESGNWVASAGDINGDGFDDLLIAAYHGDSTGNALQDAGESYVLFGKAS